MRRRTLIFGSLASLYAAAARADSWSLVTQEEFEKARSAPQVETPTPDSRPPAPTITVEQPDARKPIASPISIRLSFQPALGANIDPKTFHVTYGFGLFAIDITSRILEHATLTSSGISADNAQLPSGHHRVTVQIADDHGRVGTHTFEFTVV